MSITIKPSEDGSYILTTYKGPVNGQIIMEQIIKAHTLGKKLGIHKYLTDMIEAPHTDNIFKQYNFAYKDVNLDTHVDRWARVAVVLDPDDHSHDFSETVLRNVGLDVTFFRDMQEAIDYLLE